MKRIARWGLVLTLVGCDAVRADEVEPFQGIVEYEERSLGFELPGRVIALPVTEGDGVAEGADLARLDDTIERLTRDARLAEVDAMTAQVALLRAGPRSEEVRGLAAQLRGARSREELEERNLARQRDLAARGALGTAVLDEGSGRLAQATAQRETLEQQLRALREGAREEELAVAEARLAAARIAVNASDERLARHTLHAPLAGTVLDVHVEAGEIAAAGAPVVTMADVKRPFVDVFVPQARITHVREGATAEVHVDGTTEAFSARVESIGRRTEFTPRFLFSEQERPNLVVRVRLRVEDTAGHLHAGIPAFATIDEGS